MQAAFEVQAIRIPKIMICRLLAFDIKRELQIATRDKTPIAGPTNQPKRTAIDVPINIICSLLALDIMKEVAKAPTDKPPKSAPATRPTWTSEKPNKLFQAVLITGTPTKTA